jgi:uncharacterized protein VirK/YbjX
MSQHETFEDVLNDCNNLQGEINEKFINGFLDINKALKQIFENFHFVGEHLNSLHERVNKLEGNIDLEESND